MTPDEITTIRAGFDVLADDPAGLASEFYRRLFDLDPSLRPMFRSDIHEQGMKLVSMLGLVVRSLDRLDTLVPAVEALGRRHRGYGVRSGDYALVGEALIATLESRLPDFGDAPRTAWTNAFGLLAAIMVAAAQERPLAA